MLVVTDKNHLGRLLKEAGKAHYTYILRRPDGIESHGGMGTPFYVGIGQNARLFEHIDDARKGAGGRRHVIIRELWAMGADVLHTLDGFHQREPWDREEEIIRTIGQIKHGTGPLANEQDYAHSRKIGGVEVRKYAGDHVDGTNNIPPKFKLGSVRLAAGPREPQSRGSVFGKIYSMLEEHPGVTGEELVGLLMRVDFTGNKSAYTQSGAVCAAWVCGYIEGGYFRSDRLHIQTYVPPAGRRVNPDSW